MEALNDNSINKTNEPHVSNDISVDKEWHENGQLKKITTYQEDVKQGEQKVWYPNGVLFCSENYKDGKLDGAFERWHPNGQLKEHVLFKNGEEEGLREGVAREWATLL